MSYHPILTEISATSLLYFLDKFCFIFNNTFSLLLFLIVFTTSKKLALDQNILYRHTIRSPDQPEKIKRNQLTFYETYIKQKAKEEIKMFNFNNLTINT